MTYNEAIQAIKKAKKIYAWINLTEHDGDYLQITKTQARKLIDSAEAGQGERKSYKITILEESGNVLIG